MNIVIKYLRVVAPTQWTNPFYLKYCKPEMYHTSSGCLAIFVLVETNRIALIIVRHCNIIAAFVDEENINIMFCLYPGCLSYYGLPSTERCETSV